MTRQVSPVPTYRKLKRSSGRHLAFVDLNGERHYLGEYDTPESKEAYQRLLAEWNVSSRQPKLAKDEITVVELVVRYLEWAKNYYIKNGKETAEPDNIRLALRPLISLYGRSCAGSFGPLALKAVRQKMVEQGGTRKYINKHVERLKRMFKWAVAEELIPPSVYEGLRAVSGLKLGRSEAPEAPPVLPVPEWLIEPVKQNVSPQVAAMIELQLLTGARPGEITIMRPIDINTTGKVWVFTPMTHKTEHHGHKRIIFIGPRAQTIILQYMSNRPLDAFMFSPAEAEAFRRQQLHLKRTTPMSCGNQPGSNCRNLAKFGNFYTVDAYRRAIDRGCELAFPAPEELRKSEDETQEEYKNRLTSQQEAELKAWYKEHHWHPHQLRHNYATNVRKDYGLELAQILLGHSNADVTQIYAERDFGRAFEVAAKIG